MTMSEAKTKMRAFADNVERGPVKLTLEEFSEGLVEVFGFRPLPDGEMAPPEASVARNAAIDVLLTADPSPRDRSLALWVLHLQGLL